MNVRVVDSRARPQGDLVQRAMAEGIEISPSSVISKVEGSLNIKSVKIAAYRKGQGRVITEQKIDCDFIAMSGGWNPALHLWCHNGGKIRFDDALASFRPNTHTDPITAVGAANGTMSVAETLAEALAAGEAAAKSVNTKAKSSKIKLPAVEEPARGALEPLWFAPATGGYNEGNKHFIDYQNDVTAADLELAQREGYESVEHTKRYTTFGMATDQGKTSNLNGLGILSEATGKSIPEIGVTTFRPPYTPYSFGAIAGALTKDLFLPIRRTPIFQWHKDKAPSSSPWPVAPRLYLSDGRRGQACRHRPRDPRGPQQGRPARCLHPRQDRDQGPRCGGIPRPHVHQHVLHPEGGQGPLRPDDERAGLPHRRRRHRASRR